MASPGPACALSFKERHNMYLSVGGILGVLWAFRMVCVYKAWSYEMEADSTMKNRDKRAHFVDSFLMLVLNPVANTAFNWLEADGCAGFRRKSG
jgi:hypothetical protein